MRPKAHATSGAVTTVATMLMVPAVASDRRQPLHPSGIARRARAPPAINAAVPATLSCHPRSRTVCVSHSGAAAPRASTAHGDVGRCMRRVTRTTASITAARTAGGGAPMALSMGDEQQLTYTINVRPPALPAALPLGTYQSRVEIAGACLANGARRQPAR